LPVVLTAYIGRNSSLGWLAVFGGVVWALIIDVGVMKWVGNHLDGREPELLALLAPLAVN
jgi:hypothetical protein